jgi:hypothetical protein
MIGMINARSIALKLRKGKSKILQRSGAAILLISPSRLVLISCEYGVFLGRPFKTNDLDCFLIDPLEIFRLETVQTTGTNMGPYNLLDGFPTCLVQFLERT